MIADTTENLDAYLERMQAMPKVQAMSPESIVDTVERLLAWLAAADPWTPERSGTKPSTSEECAAYLGNRYTPYVSDADGNTRILDSSGALLVETPTPIARLEDEDADAAYELASELFEPDQSWAKGHLSDDLLGEKLHMTSITEQNDGHDLAVILSSTFRMAQKEVQAFRRAAPRYRLGACVYGHVSLEVERKTGRIVRHRLELATKHGSTYLDHLGRPNATLEHWIEAALFEQWHRRYRWQIEVAFSKHRTGVALDTDAEGARAFLSLRDKGPTGRRDPLVHWVRQHYRRRRRASDEVSLSLVREHLRGKVMCAFGGLTCRVWPSRLDIERASNGARFDRVLGVGT